MISLFKTILIHSMLFTAIIALPNYLVKRREHQENPAMLSQINDLEKTAQLRNGRFEQITKAFVSTLLDEADPCDRYAFIDEIIKLCKFGNCGQEGIQVAAKLAMLEKNFKVFTGARKPAFCNNPAIPASPEIRCIVPVIDPDFPGAAEFNTKAKARFVDIQAKPNPELCVGQSVQQQVLGLGISGCKGCDQAAGGAPPVPVGVRVASDVFSRLFDFGSRINYAGKPADVSPAAETDVCAFEPNSSNPPKNTPATPPAPSPPAKTNPPQNTPTTPPAPNPPTKTNPPQNTPSTPVTPNPPAKTNPPQNTPSTPVTPNPPVKTNPPGTSKPVDASPGSAKSGGSGTVADNNPTQTEGCEEDPPKNANPGSAKSGGSGTVADNNPTQTEDCEEDPPKKANPGSAKSGGSGTVADNNPTPTEDCEEDPPKKANPGSAKSGGSGTVADSNPTPTEDCEEEPKKPANSGNSTKSAKSVVVNKKKNP